MRCVLCVLCVQGGTGPAPGDGERQQEGRRSGASHGQDKVPQVCDGGSHHHPPY